MMKKLIIALSIALMLGTTVSAASFSDVDDSTNYKDAILWMADNGVIDGDPEGTFRPRDCVNRAEMLKLLFEATGEGLNYSADEPAYSDVDNEAWYAPYVRIATEKGTIVGYEDGSFRPGQCVNRVEAIKMAVLEFNGGEVPAFDGYAGVNIFLDSYKDVDFEEWYGDFMRWVLVADAVGQNHVAEVYNANSDAGVDRYYSPGANMPRMEVAEMLYRIKAVIDNDAAKYNDSLVPDQIAIEIFEEDTISGTIHWDDHVYLTMDEILVPLQIQETTEFIDIPEDRLTEDQIIMIEASESDYLTLSLITDLSEYLVEGDEVSINGHYHPDDSALFVADEIIFL